MVLRVPQLRLKAATFGRNVGIITQDNMGLPGSYRCIYIYTYMHSFIHFDVFVPIVHIFKQKERERERERMVLARALCPIQPVAFRRRRHVLKQPDANLNNSVARHMSHSHGSFYTAPWPLGHVCVYVHIYIYSY